MNPSKHLARTFRFLKGSRTQDHTDTHSKNELIHPRFEMTITDTAEKGKVPDSLLFLMYSKENDTLFI